MGNYVSEEEVPGHPRRDFILKTFQGDLGKLEVGLQDQSTGFLLCIKEWFRGPVGAFGRAGTR